MDQKKTALLEEIDLARCRAQWATSLELSKKYKKLLPEDSVLDITITTEVELIQLLKSTFDIEKKGWDVIHQHDDLVHTALLPIISPNKVAHLIKRLDFLNLEQNENVELTSTDNWQTQFSKILLARIYFESGQYELALTALQNLALRIEDVQTGYGLVLLVQARAIKGICLEKSQNYDAAIEAYDAAWSAVELQPQERGVMLSFWIEECLYRGILLRLRLNHPVKDTLGMMRAYIQLVSSHWSPHWRMFRRWVIFKFYVDYLVKVYQDNTYIPPTKNTSPEVPDELAAFEELSVLMNLFRSLFTIISPNLNAKSQSEYGMSLANMIMESHNIMGWGEINHIRRVLQYLYQVKVATFNDPTVNRYIFFTLLRLGSLEEAKFALRAYLDLMGVPDFDTGYILDDTIGKLHGETINPEKKDSATDITKALTTTSKADSIIIRLPEYANESIDSVIDVILSGVKLYGHEEQNGKLAAYLSDLALDLLIVSDNKTKLCRVYRARGTSYGLIASQCEDHDLRARHHEESVRSLEQSISVYSCWKSYYELALQQALVRDTHAAINSISKSIELRPDHVESWHLLALLYSCKRTDDLPKALKTLEAGLQLSTKNVSSATSIPVFSWNTNEVNASDLYKKAESYLSIRMSQLTLKEAMEGPENVMDQYKELFEIYTQLTQELGITAVVDELPSPVPVPASPTRKRKTSLSLIRRTSLTSVKSSSSNGTDPRPRASSVEESSRPSQPQRSNSEIDYLSDDSSVSTSLTRQSSARRSSSNRTQPPVASSIPRTNSLLNDTDLKKRSLQLIDLGLARRIGTAAANPAQHNGKQHDSSRSLVSESGLNSSAVSLASLLTPAYSMGSLRSNSVSSRTSKAVTRDGLIVSTFHQHHQAFEIRQKTRWHGLLVTLWLMSTKTFIKAGLLDEANKALGEAEQLGLGDPGVWYQLGQLSLKARDLIEAKQKKSNQDSRAIKEMNHVAADAFEKALVLDADHVPSQVAKASLLLDSQQDLADGLLQQITLGLGWDSAEAWYQHAKLHSALGSLDRAKTCYLFALELNDTEPLRNLNILPRFI
ncbi:hypothetical protein HPULCUR_001149 [Helicostylum pulchrum]|uniref:Cargo-transport protein ypp1 n=1 Tax=Helicostylum pulchrum TaxID=562976 RepID=A0ABP9XP02_9FUNG